MRSTKALKSYWIRRCGYADRKGEWVVFPYPDQCRSGVSERELVEALEQMAERASWREFVFILQYGPCYFTVAADLRWIGCNLQAIWTLDGTVLGSVASPERAVLRRVRGICAT